MTVTSFGNRPGVRAVIGVTLLAACAATRIPIVAAAAALVLLCYVPGMLIVRGAALADGWCRNGRAVLSVGLSLAVTPVVLNPLWHVSNNRLFLLGGVWLALCVAAAALIRDEERRGETAPRPLFEHRSTKVLAGLLLALLLLATVGPYWPSDMLGHPSPCAIHDFVKHHAVLFSMEHRPLPLGNPFYADGADGPVYYYHFFYLIPATLRQVAGGWSIEAAFAVQSALVACATVGFFYLIVKRFARSESPATLAMLLCTAVGALDVIPLAIRGDRVITVDAWADHVMRIHNFLNQMMWSPQNVQGVLIVLVGVYVLSVRGWWRGWLVLAPVLGASLVGSSVWVALPVLCGLTVYVVTEVVTRLGDSKEALRRLLGASLAALLMLALSAHSLWGYSQMAARHDRGLTTEWPRQWNALLGRLVPPGVPANVLDLPWVLLFELGALLVFPLLAPRRVWRNAWHDPGLRLLLLAAMVAVPGYVTIRSNFMYNDFGQKSMMVAMAAGLVLGACVVDPLGGRARWFNPLGWRLNERWTGRSRTVVGTAMGVILILGLPLAFYEIPLTAVRRYISSGGPLAMFAVGNAELVEKEAGAYAFCRDGLPRDAVLQPHWGHDRVQMTQIARKQLGVTVLEADTMVFYPKDAASFTVCLDEVSGVLAGDATAEVCAEILSRHGITHLFVGEFERSDWRHLERLEDERYFTTVYEDAWAAVVAIREPTPKTEH